MKRKKKAWIDLKNNRISYKDYRKTANSVTKELKLIKKKYEDKLFQSNNKKQFYSYINRILNEDHCIPRLKLNEQELTDEEAANLFVMHFKSVYEPESQVITFDIESDPEDISEEELVMSLKRITPSKPAGEDGIHPTIIHNCFYELIEPLHQLYNKSLRERKVPNGLKKSRVTPIFKSGNRYDVKNYRPIHVTDALSKPLESIMMQRMQKHLVETNFKNENQHGFCQKRSVTTNLLESTYDWINSLDQNLVTHVIYFDFSKAFDKMNINRLLIQMRTLCFPEYIISWTQDYLRNRSMHVRIGNKTSIDVHITSGVPQGSVLGPFLFRLYVSSTPTLSFCKLKQFADDVKLYASFNPNSITAHKSIQEDVNTFVMWTQDNLQMTLNSSKTTVLHIGSKNPKHNYFIDKTKLNQTNYQRDLGILISRDLSFEKHIFNTIQSTFGIIYMIKKSFTSLTKKQFMIIYKFRWSSSKSSTTILCFAIKLNRN